jgi:hypothetical protein
MSKIIQGLSREEMDGADLPKHAPPWPIGCKHKVLVIICNMFGTGVWWPAREVGIMYFQKLSSHGSRCRHHHVDEAEPEVHERSISLCQGCHGVVRHRPQMG